MAEDGPAEPTVPEPVRVFRCLLCSAESHGAVEYGSQFEAISHVKSLHSSDLERDVVFAEELLGARWTLPGEDAPAPKVVRVVANLEDELDRWCAVCGRYFASWRPLRWHLAVDHQAVRLSYGEHWTDRSLLGVQCDLVVDAFSSRMVIVDTVGDFLLEVGVGRGERGPGDDI